MEPVSLEDEFLARLGRGGLVSQDEYDQIAEALPPETLAGALARRFENGGETRMLVESARLYLLAGFYYEALEVCSRAQRYPALEKIIQQALPQVRADYPDTKLVGKLTDGAFLVIDVTSGTILRFPPLLPARG